MVLGIPRGLSSEEEKQWQQHREQPREASAAVLAAAAVGAAIIVCFRHLRSRLRGAQLEHVSATRLRPIIHALLSRDGRRHHGRNLLIGILRIELRGGVQFNLHINLGRVRLQKGEALAGEIWGLHKLLRTMTVEAGAEGVRPDHVVLLTHILGVPGVDGVSEMIRGRVVVLRQTEHTTTHLFGVFGAAARSLANRPIVTREVVIRIALQTLAEIHT